SAPPPSTPPPSTPQARGSAPLEETRREGPSAEVLPSAPSPGTVMGGKYRIERGIGIGGMAIGLAARHLSLDQPRAVKVLKPELARRPHIVARFLREGRAAAKITSEHVVRVFDADRFDPWGPALVMELLEGQDFHAMLTDPGARPLPVPRAVDYVLQ